MKTSFPRLLKSILLCFIVLSCLLSMERLSIATNRHEGSKLIRLPHVNHRETEMAEILSFLEDKVGITGEGEKLRDKVFRLSDKQIRLIASLVRLTADDDQAAGAEIVFFVITILLIVS